SVDPLPALPRAAPAGPLRAPRRVPHRALPDRSDRPALRLLRGSRRRFVDGPRDGQKRLRAKRCGDPRAFADAARHPRRTAPRRRCVFPPCHLDQRQDRGSAGTAQRDRGRGTAALRPARAARQPRASGKCRHSREPGGRAVPRYGGLHPGGATRMSGRMELVCPAGTPAALRAAVLAGADAVYCGFRDETNARNFPGLNFSPEEMAEGIRFAHDNGSKVLVAINTFARAERTDIWRRAADTAVACGADAIIAADIAVLDHMARNHQQTRLHLSVQAAAATPEAIGFYAQAFGVRRVVLPRVLSVQEIATLNRAIETETEAFVFGGLCVMMEGRCHLSSYGTGKSPNLNGVC